MALIARSIRRGATHHGRAMAQKVVEKCKSPLQELRRGSTLASGLRSTALEASDGFRDSHWGSAQLMPASVPVGHPWLHVAIAAGLLLPLQGLAQSAPKGRSATSSFSISLTIRPQFRILESRPVAGGHEYRVWTNMKSVQLNGQEYRFERVGEATLTVPGAFVEIPADQSSPLQAQQGS